MIEIRRVVIGDWTAKYDARKANPQAVIYIVIHNYRRVDSFIRYQNAQLCVKRLKGKL